MTLEYKVNCYTGTFNKIKVFLVGLLTIMLFQLVKLFDYECA